MSSTLAGWATFEVTSLATRWTVAEGDTYSTNNHGIIISAESDYTQLDCYSKNYSSNKPFWSMTTETGTSETTQDLYFEVISEAGNGRSTCLYSKRYYPEHYPTLNTIQIPGRIVGLAKSGGYLIVAGKNPDALHFYKYTGSTNDGEGLNFVTSAVGITFGSSKSVAYLPMGQGFIFFSGLGVYHQNGLQSTLLSGRIREEAKLLANYRDPEQYYSGFASLMPQSTVLPTKDLYLLVAPTTEASNSNIYTFNYADNLWARWTNIETTAMEIRRSGGAEPVLYMGDSSGNTYTLDTTGSTTEEAVLQWYLSFRDITARKTLSEVLLWGRADNPLTSCFVTLEVSSTDPVSGDTQTETEYLTEDVDDNTTTDNMVEVVFSPGLKAREFKLRLTQQATQGAISWRAIKWSGDID